MVRTQRICGYFHGVHRPNRNHSKLFFSDETRSTTQKSNEDSLNLQ